MTGQLGVTGVYFGVVTARFGHARAQIVGCDRDRDAAKCLEGVHMRHGPALEALVGGRLDIEHPRAALPTGQPAEPDRRLLARPFHGSAAADLLKDKKVPVP